MDNHTPRARAAHLLTMLSDDSMILAHIKRDFNYIMTQRELNTIKRTLPKDVKRVRQAAAEPIRGNDRAFQVGPADPLLKALAAFELKYGTWCNKAKKRVALTQSQRFSLEAIAR